MAMTTLSSALRRITRGVFMAFVLRAAQGPDAPSLGVAIAGCRDGWASAQVERLIARNPWLCHAACSRQAARAALGRRTMRAKPTAKAEVTVYIMKALR